MLGMKPWVVPAFMATLTLAGCGSGVSTAPASVAERFYAAVASGDGAAACALLAPPTVEEVERSGNAPCRSAILDEDVPQTAEVVELKRYGDQAQVRLRDDTAFLAEFDNGWKVVAVACTPRGELPYDCKVKG
jgi:hypothetical protein